MSNYNYKPAYRQERTVLGKTLPLDTPFAIYISASGACNFKCKYCVRSCTDLAEDNWHNMQINMEWDVFRRLIDQLQDFHSSVKDITFSVSGEPLVNPRIADMVRYIKEKSPNTGVRIATNASLLDHNLSLELIDAGLDRLLISLQGVSARKYKEICAYDIDFDKLVDNIKFFFENKKHTEMIVKTVDIALDEGDEKIFQEMLGPIADGIIVENIVPVFSEVDYSGMDLQSTRKTDNRFQAGLGKQKYCSIATYSLVIAPNGDIFPCCSPFEHPPVHLGNIKHDSLLDAWSGEKRKKFLLEMFKGGFEAIKGCRGCYQAEDCVKVNEDVLDPYIDEILERME